MLRLHLKLSIAAKEHLETGNKHVIVQKLTEQQLHNSFINILVDVFVIVVILVLVVFVVVFAVAVVFALECVCVCLSFFSRRRKRLCWKCGKLRM